MKRNGFIAEDQRGREEDYGPTGASCGAISSMMAESDLRYRRRTCSPLTSASPPFGVGTGAGTGVTPVPLIHILTRMIKMWNGVMGMPRQPRVAPAPFTYHVMNRGNHGETLFSERRDHEEFLMLLKKYKKKFRILIYHYVLMPNHVHLEMEQTENGGLAKFMHVVCMSYARRLNLRLKRTGHVWQSRYYSSVIKDDEYFLQCGKYIELNPVRAGIVSAPEAYPWSSYLMYSEGKNDPIVDQDPLYASLGSSLSARQSLYRKIVAVEPVEP